MTGTLLRGCGSPPEEPEPSRKPLADNLLLITIDTLRADHLGFHGYPRQTSPFLDQLAGRSVRYLDASSQASVTLPSIASLLTARHPRSNGVERNDGVLASSETTLAEVLQTRGFVTAAVTTNGNLVPSRGVDQGFQRFTFLPPPADASALTDGALPELTNLLSLSSKGDAKPRWFLWLHYIDPHGPYDPPPDYADSFVGDSFYDGSAGVRLRVDETRSIGWNQGLGGVPHYQRRLFLEHPRRRQRDFYIARYDAEIRYLDDQLRRLFQILEDAGHLDRTLVAFTADHGEALGEHDYFFGHGWYVYEHQVHVPLLLHLPQAPAQDETAQGEPAAPRLEPRSVDGPVGLVDLAPTLLELLGVEAPPSFQGRSLDPWTGGSTAPRRAVYSTTPDALPHRHQALRLGPWKYLRDQRRPKDQRREQLFHLERDPEELRSVAEDEPAMLEELRRLFDAGPWLASPERADDAAEAPAAPLSEEEEESLRSLGYL